MSWSPGAYNAMPNDLEPRRRLTWFGWATRKPRAVTDDTAAEVWKVYGNYLLGFEPGAGKGIEAMKAALEHYERLRK